MFSVGQKCTFQRCFSRADVEAYGQLAGALADVDHVPEPMIAALFSYVLGVKLPGPGTNYLKQSLAFERVARIGHALCVNLEITRVRQEKALLDLSTTCTTAGGAVICRGRALVRVKDVGAHLS